MKEGLILLGGVVVYLMGYLLLILGVVGGLLFLGCNVMHVCTIP